MRMANIIFLSSLEAQYTCDPYFRYLFQDFVFWHSFKRLFDQLLCVHNFRYCLVLFSSIGRCLKVERDVGLFFCITDKERERIIGLLNVTTLNKLPGLSLELTCISYANLGEPK